MSDETAGDAFKELLAIVEGIAAIALSMSMKYHDINTVQDGVLYQQYKMEGKNLHGLHLDQVLDTASKIEAWLLQAPERIAKLIIDQLPEEQEAVEGQDAALAEGDASKPDTVVD